MTRAGGHVESLNGVEILDTAVWSNGGVAKALTVAFVADSWIDTERATELAIGITGGATAPTSIDLEVEWSPDSGTNAYPLDAINFVAGGQIDTDDAEWVTPGANGKHTATISIKPGMSIRVSAKRTGGDATSTLLAMGTFLRV